MIIFYFSLGMSYRELDERLENDPNIIVCWKWNSSRHDYYALLTFNWAAWDIVVAPGLFCLMKNSMA